MDKRLHPSRRLAEQIVARLLRERLLTAQQVNRIQSRLADGKLSPAEWCQIVQPAATRKVQS